MVIVQKENRQLRVDDSRLQDYLDKGYFQVVLEPVNVEKEVEKKKKKSEK